MSFNALKFSSKFHIAYSIMPYVPINEQAISRKVNAKITFIQLSEIYDA